MSKKGVVILLVIAVIVSVLLLTTIFSISRDSRRSVDHIDEQTLSATVFNQQRGVVDFTLLDSDGNEFTRDSLYGQWTLLFFGFTNCTAICPIVLPEMRQAFLELEKDGSIPYVQMAMVTVDPARDTVEELDAYMSSYHPSFFGVTGDKNELEKLRESFGIMAMDPHMDHSQHHDMSNEPEFNYQVQHSGSLVLTGPDGNWYAVFSMPHRGSEIAHDLAAITKYFRQT